jgi:hypothetical protein
MAFASNLTINDSAAAAKVFAAVSIEGSETIRMDQSTTNLAPRTMIIRHAQSTDKLSKAVVDRHLLSFQHRVLDSNGVPFVQTGNFTLFTPRASVITRADTDHLIAFIRNFMGVTENVDSFLRNES